MKRSIFLSTIFSLLLLCGCGNAIQKNIIVTNMTDTVVAECVNNATIGNNSAYISLNRPELRTEISNDEYFVKIVIKILDEFQKKHHVLIDSWCFDKTGDSPTTVGLCVTFVRPKNNPSPQPSSKMIEDPNHGI